MSTRLSDPVSGDLSALLQELVRLREQVALDAESRLAAYRARYPQGCPADARNLASYLALRSRDLRPLQERLVAAGVSSLGRGESQVRTNLDRVIGILSEALGMGSSPVLPEDGHQCLEHNTGRLFGKRRHKRYARIMVTLPSEAAGSDELVAGLAASGMDCARINCAHDGPVLWQGMIDNVRAVEKKTGSRLKIFMDLGGHKIRTGPVAAGPAVLHLKVPRDALGRRTGRARVLLYDEGAAPPVGPQAAGLPLLPVSGQLLEQVQAGDRLAFSDSRRKRRYLRVCERLPAGEWLVETTRSAYITPGTRLYRQAGAGPVSGSGFHVGEFPGKPLAIRLFRGEQLLLTRGTRPGRPAAVSDHSSQPAQISCSHAVIVDELRPGHAVWIDDGKLGCVVEKVTEQGALLQVTHAGPRGVRIRADKGINLPDTPLPLPALTEKDLTDLDFVCAHADMVGLSFVRQLDDIDELRRQLAARGRSDLPIVIKIGRHDRAGRPGRGTGQCAHGGDSGGNPLDL
jgi:pyruvate kinase